MWQLKYLLKNTKLKRLSVFLSSLWTFRVLFVTIAHIVKNEKQAKRKQTNKNVPAIIYNVHTLKGICCSLAYMLHNQIYKSTYNRFIYNTQKVNDGRRGAVSCCLHLKSLPVCTTEYRKNAMKRKWSTGRAEISAWRVDYFASVSSLSQQPALYK